MSSERLVLSFENDVPVGYVTERVTSAMAMTDDWLYFVDKASARGPAEMVELPRDRSTSRYDGFASERLYVDGDGNIWNGAFRGDVEEQLYAVFRVCFNAGVMADEREREGMLFDEMWRGPSGTLVYNDYEKRLYVICDTEKEEEWDAGEISKVIRRRIASFLDAQKPADDVDAWTDLSRFQMFQSHVKRYFLFVRTTPRDDEYVLK